MAIGSLLIMFNRMAELKRALSPPDVYLVPKVDQFGGTEFFRVREILAAAEPAKEDLHRRMERLVQSSPAALLTANDAKAD
jgi:NTE family protein